MGKGALTVALAQIEDELGAMSGDPKRAALARRVDDSLGRIQDAAKVLFSDLSYALLRAKLIAEMVINAMSATELLHQVGADAVRLDLAEAFVRRRVIESESMAKRIEQNHVGRLERDSRILAGYAASEG